VTPLPPRGTATPPREPEPVDPPTEHKPPETAEHWRRAHRYLRGGVLVAGGFLVGALVALAVVFIDPTERDVPKHPRTVTVTHTQTQIETTTTEAQPTVPDVLGKKPGEARSILEAAGFQVAFSEQTVICAISQDLCQVVDTDPPAGAQAAPGTEVTVSIDNA
jgi:beta-lactam-binding protein with PASTA domain